MVGLMRVRFLAAALAATLLAGAAADALPCDEVARRLKSMRASSDIRLIAVTGYGQEEDLAAASDAGFEAHLTKPVDPAELLRAIG